MIYIPLKSLHFYSEDCNISGAKVDSLSTFLGGFRINQNSINDVITCTGSSDTSVLGFCRGSASVPRGFVSLELGAETQSQCETTAAVVDTGRATPPMGDQCDSMPHV